MLRICIPVHNEATTVGVLLWRLRSVFQGFSREYDVTVYDDASTDETVEVLEPYQSVMPLTVLRGAKHVGYAGSIDALVRHVAADDEYARRDAMVLMQGDFTESPEHLPELVKRFEGGADLVAVHRITSADTPTDERRLRRWGSWAVKPFLRMPPVADPFTGFRLVRIAVLRDLLKAMGARPVCAGDGWAANIDFALNVTPFARRIENVEFAPRYDVRQRASRRRGWSDVVALFHWARSARKTVRPAPGARAAVDVPARADAPTVVGPPADRLRVTTADRAERAGRGDRTRPTREGRQPREERTPEERPKREDRPPREAREGRNAREERALRGAERPASTDRPPREPRPERPPRPNRPTRDEVPASAAIDPVEVIEAAPVIAAPDAATDGTVASESIELVEGAPAKRKRRRRRSRKKGKGPATGSEETTDDTDEGDEGAPDAPESADAAGTSDEGEGEQEEGADDSEGPESAAGEGGAEGARRRRRSRRRRRGRRPTADGGTGEAGAGESPLPPAAEPPAA